MRALLVAVTFISTSAMACPNLAGSYKVCRSTTGHSSGSTDMVVSQSVQNKVTVYNVSATNAETQTRETEVYKTDGKPVVAKYEDSGMVLVTKTVSTCAGTTLNINVDMSLNGQEMGWSKVKVTKAGKQLVIESKSFDGERENSDKEICE